MKPLKAIYIFLDEGGDLNFSLKGSQYFSLTSLSMARPFSGYPELDDLRYHLLETGLELEYFHAANDTSRVRYPCFRVIQGLKGQAIADCLLVEKAKAHPKVRDELRFYPEMVGYLLRYAIGKIDLRMTEEVIVITDTLPLEKKRKAMEKAIKTVLADMLPATCHYRVMHHASRAHLGLQMADYLNWAIWRKWERGRDDFYRMVDPLVRSEFDIFVSGTTRFY